MTGVLHGSAVFAEHVRAREGAGTLVNISSGAATNPYEGWAAYCASKAAVDQLTRVVALEEARHGLAAYAVSPGLVDTEMQAAIRATDPASFPQVDRFRRAATEHRFNSPAWVAEHILALAFGPEPPVEGHRAHPGPGHRARPRRVRSSPMAKSGARKVVKPVAAAAVTLGTIASIWWFALKPRRKAKHAATVASSHRSALRGARDRLVIRRAGKPSTRAGRHSPIGPCRTTSARESISVGSPFTMITTAPCRTATGTRPAAGKTASVEPTASSRSHDAAAASARNRSSATRFWPKLMVADLRMPPQATPSGQRRRARRVVLAGAHALVDGLRRLAVAAGEADHVERGPMDLNDPLRVGAGLLVQPVDVLRHEHVEPAAAFEVHQGPVPCVGLRRPHG